MCDTTEGSVQNTKANVLKSNYNVRGGPFRERIVRKITREESAILERGKIVHAVVSESTNETGECTTAGGNIWIRKKKKAVE